MAKGLIYKATNKIIGKTKNYGGLSNGEIN